MTLMVSTVKVSCSCDIAFAVAVAVELVVGYYVAIDAIGVVCIIGEWFCD